MPEQIDPETAVLDGIIGNIRGDEKAGGWKVVLDFPESEAAAIARVVPWYKQRVRVVIVPVPDQF